MTANEAASERAQTDTPVAAASKADPVASKAKKKKRKKSAGTKRGIETMYQAAYSTHLDLSHLADTKANIMISLNGIIITIIVARLASTFETDIVLLIPAGVLLVTCMITMVLSVFAAMPRIRSEAVDLGDVRAGRKNILFFGTFTRIPEEDFVAGMAHLMERRSDIYAGMARDLYALGGVLAKKYRLIRAAYIVFMTGLVIGVSALLVILLSGLLTS